MINLCELLYRLVWAIILCVAISLFSYMLIKNINRLSSYPTNVDIKVEYVTPLDFPAVTICNENKYRLINYIYYTVFRLLHMFGV